MYYLKRNDTGILIKDGSKEYQINTGLKKYINDLCMENLSTYDGRRLAIASLLKQIDNIPIYINKHIFIFPTKSLREYDMLFINYFSILSVKKYDENHTLIIFENLEELVVEASIKKIIKQQKRIEKITDYSVNTL